MFNVAEQVEDLLGHIVKLLLDAPSVEKKFAGAGLVLSEQIVTAVEGFAAKVNRQPFASSSPQFDDKRIQTYIKT